MLSILKNEMLASLMNEHILERMEMGARSTRNRGTTAILEIVHLSENCSPRTGSPGRFWQREKKCERR
ncbi:hypothetical protein Y032_0293g1616 [Ancylostoma ceylanicum]|uniref:Uncharacterized protein n=1 Tax=Ancylostoma ceylanicum TaxID=53326 RepID=A0A016S4Y7_9BILA|nr:hypothetical protein Y032_0293g1616 [Ancylostoma ceylanicum]